MKTLRALMEERHTKISLMEEVVQKAEREGRELKPEERVRFDRIERQVRQLDGQIAALEEEARQSDPGREERRRNMRGVVGVQEGAEQRTVGAWLAEAIAETRSLFGSTGAGQYVTPPEYLNQVWDLLSAE